MALYYRLLARLGRTHLARAVAPGILTPLDRFLYRRTQGRVISVGPPVLPMLMLTTTGRHTGRSHEVPLLYLVAGDDLVVIATNWGRERHPGWSANLIADPAATVQLGADRFPVVAALADHEEKQALWPAICDLWPAYDTYAEVSGRDIRVFRLSRRAA